MNFCSSKQPAAASSRKQIGNNYVRTLWLEVMIGVAQCAKLAAPMRTVLLLQ